MTENQFAKALGFSDYAELLASSDVVAHEENDVQWYITHLPDGRWAAWDDAELGVDRVDYAEDKDGALRHIYDGLEASGYDLDDDPVVPKYRIRRQRKWYIDDVFHFRGEVYDRGYYIREDGIIEWYDPATGEKHEFPVEECRHPLNHIRFLEPGNPIMVEDGELLGVRVTGDEGK